MKNGRQVVLIVEDDHLIRMSVVDLVLSARYDALEAGDADEAIHFLELRVILILFSQMSKCRGRWTVSNWLTTSAIDGRR